MAAGTRVRRSQAFETKPSAFFNEESKARLKSFRPLFLSELTAEVEQRRKLRPLLDAVTRVGG
jgi:hypothetical protein